MTTPPPFLGDQRLRKCERILRRSEYRLIQAKGRRFFTRTLVVVTHNGSAEWTRIGITVSRKVGKAVYRNQLKRWIREIFRRNKANFPRKADIVFILKSLPESITYADLARDIGTYNRKARRRC